MGHIKNIANQPKLQTFPGAIFETAGTVPVAQCSEAKIQGDHGDTSGPGWRLVDPGKFAGYNLNNKICTITKSPTGSTGDFDIENHTDDHLNLFQDPGDSIDVEYYVHDGGELIITRNIQTFAEFISSQHYPYTIKGGILYTSMPSNLFQNACSILFDPLT